MGKVLLSVIALLIVIIASKNNQEKTLEAEQERDLISNDSGTLPEILLIGSNCTQ
jgi:hypothetical protein